MPCHKIDVKFPLFNQSLGDLGKELITVAYEIYKFLLEESDSVGSITLVCPGQSPAYFALAMKYFSIYDIKRVEIVILPHSKCGSTVCSLEERKTYGFLLKQTGIIFRDNIYILDTVHTGAGVRSLEMSLRYNNMGKVIRFLAINYPSVDPGIAVYRRFKAYCVPRLSDSFPRIVQYFNPSTLSKGPFFDCFINLQNNEYVDMVRDLAISYEKGSLEETGWFKLNCDKKN